MLLRTLFPSPNQAISRPGKALPCSTRVNRSAMIWHGCERSVRPLITGTLALAAISSIFAWSSVRIMIASHILDKTLAVSATVSPRPSCIEPLSMTILDPPSWRIAISNETRVRVLLFSKIIARTWSASGRSASGLPFGQSARAALRSIASAIIAAIASPPASARLRKERVMIPAPDNLQHRQRASQ